MKVGSATESNCRRAGFAIARGNALLCAVHENPTFRAWRSTLRNLSSECRGKSAEHREKSATFQAETATLRDRSAKRRPQGAKLRAQSPGRRAKNTAFRDKSLERRAQRLAFQAQSAVSAPPRIPHPFKQKTHQLWGSQCLVKIASSFTWRSRSHTYCAAIRLRGRIAGARLKGGISIRSFSRT